MRLIRLNASKAGDDLLTEFRHKLGITICRRDKGDLLDPGVFKAVQPLNKHLRRICLSRQSPFCQM